MIYGRRRPNIKAALDNVCVIIKLMPAGRGGTDAGWIAYVLDRTPSALAMEYYRQMMLDPIEVQQKAARNTRSFAVLLPCWVRRTTT